MREAVLAVQIAGMSAFSASKACLAITACNRLIAPRANRIDRRIAIVPPRERNKGRHPITSVRWPPSERLKLHWEGCRFPRYGRDCRQVWSQLLVSIRLFERILSSALLRQLSICPHGSRRSGSKLEAIRLRMRKTEASQPGPRITGPGKAPYGRKWEPPL